VLGLPWPVVLIRRLAIFGTSAVAAMGVGCAAAMPTALPPPPLRSPPPALGACGVERWAVKTLSDSDAFRINFSPIPATIAALAGLAPHCGRASDTSRPYPEELSVFEVVGRVTYVRLEDDRDYHVALVDPVDGVSSIVVEVDDPGCVGDEAGVLARTLLAAGRRSFEDLLVGRTLAGLVGQTVVVRGVGFYDQNHGQTGRSASCIELHPVLSIARTGQ
jgi:hypothetical protein